MQVRPIRRFATFIYLIAAVVLAAPSARAAGLSPGDILVADSLPGALFRVDPVTGDRSVVAGCGDEACSFLVGGGVDPLSPADVTVTPAGAIYVPTGNAIAEIDPITGDRAHDLA